MCEPSGLEWFKSSYSDDRGAECVEVAIAPSAVYARDSKDPGGPALAFSPAAWSAFVAFASKQ
ncbi:DUF397 domain-containing protein [Allostreptomyces psammosilenae]|uniref:DUF397 domain-containing protein n=1 Tax=Allostreptomyces psammosilenae TaxID=1892865 RepID=A0A852ZYM2_9ACTN|nr:hypothetical protein [Allostreptomyces psammosilenae]